ncbi:uncharacterized protein TNCV_1298731 [Trichonephila clavipes]|nr:uncharacterized protein TNCV_1298731 [Trichonephila clavipes]
MVRTNVDVPIDLACYGFNLSMLGCSANLNNSPPSKKSFTTEMVSFKDVLLVVTGTWSSPYEKLARNRLRAKLGFVGKHYTRPLLWCP